VIDMTSWEHRGDERLVRACMRFDRVFAERACARTRLELELGEREARALVASLARRDTSASFKRSAQWRKPPARRLVPTRA
jgi:hypothetical protein